jgi:hypothetical protein
VVYAEGRSSFAEDCFRALRTLYWLNIHGRGEFVRLALEEAQTD